MLSLSLRRLEQKNALVIGAKGAMGAAVCKTFKAAGWKVVGVDFKNRGGTKMGAEAEEDHCDVLVRQFQTKYHGNMGFVHNMFNLTPEEFETKVKGGEMTMPKFGAVVNCAGQFQITNPGDHMVASRKANESLTNTNIGPALDAVAIAFATDAHPRYLGDPAKAKERPPRPEVVCSPMLADDGLFVTTGAAAVLDDATEDTSVMLTYAASKAAVHQLAKSLASGQKANNDFVKSTQKVLCVCPTMLKTPSNEAAMPDQLSNMVPCDELGKRLLTWAEDSSSRPKQTFVKFAMEGSEVVVTEHKQ